MENRGDRSASKRTAARLATAGGRLEWIDVARGIGIIAVVIGHVWTRGPLRDAMYSFHMPLFFLLSGLLSRPQPVRDFTLKQLGSQLRPYAAFLALLILADQIIEPLKGNRPIFHQWPQDLLPILLGGTWLRGPYTIFWFVPCLMMARILFNALLVRWLDPFDRRWMMLLLPSLLVAYVVGKVTTASPMGLLAVPMAFCLLWAGAAWQKLGWRHWMWAPLVVLALPGLASFTPPLNMKVADYGVPLLSILSAVATSFLIFRVSGHVAHFSGWLAVVGRASLVIMYLHVAIIHYLSPFLSKPWLFAAALLLSTAAYYLIRPVPALRRVFL